MIQEIVRSEIEKGKGKQFDARIADIMLQMIDEDTNYDMCQSDKNSKNILVIDDEIMNIKMVEFILKDVLDFQVTGVETKEETFSVLETKEIHLILLDLKMLAMLDGFEDIRIERRPLAMKVKKNGKSLKIDQLSDGEKCTIALFGDLARIPTM